MRRAWGCEIPGSLYHQLLSMAIGVLSVGYGHWRACHPDINPLGEQITRP